MILRSDKLVDTITKAGAAFLGFQAFEKQSKGSGLAGAIVSLIGLKMTESPNLAAGAAGVATLTGIGILNVKDPNAPYVNAQPQVQFAGNLVGLLDFLQNIGKVGTPLFNPNKFTFP